MAVGEWKWLAHPEFGVHRVPDNPGVVEDFVARGWEVTDVPADLTSDDEDFEAALTKWRASKVPVDEPEEETAKAKSAKSKKEAE